MYSRVSPPRVSSYCHSGGSARIVPGQASVSVGQTVAASVAQHSETSAVRNTVTMAAKTAAKPVLKLKDMEEKHLHNLFLKNMSGLIEEVKNPTPRLNP